VWSSIQVGREVQGSARGDSRIVTVAVVIPTFRRPERLQNLLESLSKGTRVPDEVIVVDNDPENSAHPEPIEGLPLQVIHAGLGLNLPGARNLGWRSTSSTLCFFVDDDNIVETEAIEQLALAFKDPDIGLAGPLIYCGDDATIWCAGIRRSPWTTRTIWPLRGQSNLPEELVWPTEDMPDAFAVPRTVLEALEGLDEERFPFHYDEADLGARIRKLGLRCVVLRNARVRHYEWLKLSIGEMMVRGTTINGPERARWLPRHRIRFHAQYYRGLERLVALGIFIPIWTITTSVACLRADGIWNTRVITARAVIVGAVDGYREILTARTEPSTELSHP
jgi:GT2 family glycosyltransferase